MTETIPRAAVVAVIDRLSPTPATLEVLEAINAIPAVTVTDDMCMDAGNAFHDALAAGQSAPEAMRAALEAALPSAPSGEE